ncbi:MAG: Flp family type IVb pilin [Pseudomonadota bacterium]
MNALMNFMKDEDGVVAIEYVIIAGALVAVLVAVFTNLGTTLTTKLGEIVANIDSGS